MTYSLSPSVYLNFHQFLLAMKKFIHRYDWNMYSFQEARQIFIDHFPNITCFPDQILFNELRGQHRATLELLENRSESTVFRIKELASCYQVNKEGHCRQFKDFETYLEQPHTDQLIEQFSVPNITFSVNPQSDGSMVITRNKTPKFKATYLPNDSLLTTGEVTLINEEWIDQVEDQDKQKIKRKLALFLKKYIHQTATN